jgi:hypothetical protein
MKEILRRYYIMSNKKNTNKALNGIMVLALAPIAVGLVVNTVGRSYCKVADGIERVKYRQRLKRKIRG